MSRPTWYSIALSILFFNGFIAASKSAAGAQTIVLYFTYKAEAEVYGADKTNFIPSMHTTKTLTLYEFIENSLLPTLSRTAKDYKKPIPKARFQERYAQDKATAEPLLDTVDPDPVQAEDYLRTCGYFAGDFDMVLLLGPPRWKSLADIMQEVVNRLQAARRANEAKAEGSRQVVLKAMNRVYEWRRIDNKKAIAALRGAQIPGLKVASIPSPLDPSIQVLDMYSTIQQSPGLTSEDLTRVQKFFNNALMSKEKSSGITAEDLKETARHQLSLAAVQHHMGRVQSSATC